VKIGHTVLTAIAAAFLLCPVAGAAQIKIGVAAALTGNAAQYGVPIRKGFELAVREINGSGGAGGTRLELVIEGEQGKKEEAINSFRKLIFQDKVMMLFGPTLSNSAQASDPVAQAAKTVVFGTSNTADGITSIGDYVFRNSVTERDILPVTLKSAAQKTDLKRVAVLYGNDDIFTKSGYDNFKKALQDLKIPIAATETFAKGDVGFKPQLTNIKAGNPDAIVLSALVAEGAPIMVQARQLGIDLPFIGGNGMNSPRIFELAKNSSDNLWVGSPWSVESPTPENKQFIASYQKAYQEMPDQFAAQAYDAMYIAAQALKKIKLTGKLEADRKAVRDALPATQWTGATGPFKFRQVTGRDGKPAGYDAVQTAIVMMTKGNRYVIQK
jgi:branched-chain amino acid transport system substrate-binding protein